MKTTQLCIDNIKHTQGELWKALWMFGYVIQNIILFPLLVAIAMGISLFSGSEDFFDMMGEYFDNLSKAYGIIDSEVDKFTEVIGTSEAIVLMVIGSVFVYLMVSISGTICGAMIKSYFM
ncbi:hypothetical protein [Burkholderia contaminans]|uniref:hypothetical protein n=1 Tax=Burkholderia contaminans TaxID=488447 RepID=UPI00158B8E5F|nr:hypothetical protein [Burkholderia contaminans]